MRKDPGIPNLFPHKEELLRQIIRSKEHREAEARERKELKKIERQQAIDAALEQSAAATANPLPSHIDHDSDEETPQLIEGSPAKRQKFSDTGSTHSSRHYWRELKHVVDQSDVVLIVLDARDPLGCRSREMEQRILNSRPGPSGRPKRIVFVLNKIGLFYFYYFFVLIIYFVFLLNLFLSSFLPFSLFHF
jgi:nuclear GTP-binding protein